MPEETRRVLAAILKKIGDLGVDEFDVAQDRREITRDHRRAMQYRFLTGLDRARDALIAVPQERKR